MKELLDTTKEEDLDKKLASEFPKLAELANELSKLPAYKNWFRDFPRKVFLCDLSREFYQTYERDLATLPDKIWNSFKTKIIQQNNSDSGELISLLNEAAGYAQLEAMLNRRGIDYDEIKQPAEIGTKKKKDKRPNWIAYFEGTPVGALEVNTIFNSDEQEKYIEESTHSVEEGKPPQLIRLHPHISEGLLSKFKSVIAKSKNQFKEGCSNCQLLIVLLIVYLDHETKDVPNCKEILESYLKNLGDEEIMVVPDIRFTPI